jgi:tumor protein p53-inducible protein 3
VKVNECDTPEYDSSTEVLIKVEATAVNRADLLQSNGKYPPPKGASEILGLECTGYLVDANTNTVTDRKVMALLSGGGWADFARVHKDHVMDIPKDMSFNDAAAIPEQWITAYQLLFDVAKAKEGETALVLAAASGVGTSIIQLCKAAGLNSIAACRTVSKISKCRELGSFDGVICSQPTYDDRVKLITDGKGVDIILDPILGSFFKTNLNCLGMDARWVIYGAMGGTTITDVNLLKLLNKRACILSSTLRNRTDEYKTNLIREI